MFSQLGMGEILLILVVVLLLFGAKRIPEIAGSMGKGIREFKKNMSDVGTAMREPAERDALPPADLARQRRDEEADRPEPKRLIS